MQDYIEIEGILETNLLVTICSIREPRRTNVRQEKSDYVCPLKGLVVQIWEYGSERSQACVVGRESRGGVR